MTGVAARACTVTIARARAHQRRVAQHRRDERVPGGNAGTGGSATMGFSGAGGTLGCDDCHSPHDAQTVAPFTAERRRTDVDVAYGDGVKTNRLLKQHPGGSHGDAGVRLGLVPRLPPGTLVRRRRAQPPRRVSLKTTGRRTSTTTVADAQRRHADARCTVTGTDGPHEPRLPHADPAHRAAGGARAHLPAVSRGRAQRGHAVADGRRGTPRRSP